MEKLQFTLCFILLILLNHKLVLAQKIGDPMPNSHEILKQGVEDYQNEKYQASIDKYAKIVSGDSSYPISVYETALSYTALKKYKESTVFARKALEVDLKDKRELMLMIAANYDYDEKPDSAYYFYDLGQRIFPYTHRFRFERGATFARQKKYKEALSEYAEAIKFNPFHSNSHLQMGILASEADQPTLAILAFTTYVILNNHASNAVSVLSLAEQIAQNEYIPEKTIDKENFSFANSFEEVDMVVRSKLALQEKYKVKSDIEYKLIRQIQAICEKLPEKGTSDNYVVNFYTDFYKQLFKNDYFNGMSVHIVEAVDNESIQKMVKKKKSDVEKFVKWAREYLIELRRVKKIMFNGKEQEVKFYFDDNNHVDAIGEKMSKDEKKGGYWEYYYTSGEKLALGSYKDNNKTGVWKYFYENGKIKKSEIYNDAGKLNGELLSYYDDGCLFTKINYVNDMAEGEVLKYTSKQVLLSKTIYKNDKEDGKKVNYGKNGFPAEEYTIVNGIIEGPYVTYAESGEVSAKGTIVNGKIEGKLTYYHKNGTVSSEITYQNNQAQGFTKIYNDKGKLKKEGNYEKDKAVGEWKYYNDSEKLSLTENYSTTGELNGIAKEFDYDGVQLSELTYKKDKLISYKYLNKDGSVLKIAKTEKGTLDIQKYNWLRIKVREGHRVDGNAQGVWKNYYDNGSLKSEETYTNGELDGLYKTYHKSGQLDNETFYVKGRREGYTKAYYRNGQVSAEGYYVGNEKNGSWNYYHANGKLDTREFYNNGIINGMDIEYTTSGDISSINYYDHNKVLKEVQFHNGNVTDTITWNCGDVNLTLHYSDKKKYVTVNYLHGSKDGNYKAYYMSGQLMRDDFYKNGEQNGSAKGYYQNGKLKSEGEYLNGERNGLWKYYYYSGILDRTVNYVDGEMEGEYKSYYENAKPEFERTYTEGEKNGEMKLYGPDGLFACSLKYDHGVLVSYSYNDKNGQLLPYIPVINETVQIKTLYSNGGKAYEYGIKNGCLEGKYLVYYTNGSLCSEENFKNNEFEGKVIRYSVAGKIIEEANYSFDELNGDYKLYHENGKLKLQSKYICGTESGVSTEYDTNGKVVKTYNN